MEERRYSIGSLFSGIGGFELGLERGIPGSYTRWQVEQEAYCQKILAKHWPEAEIYDDVRGITKNNVERVDILCGGFPCQDISIANTNGRGLHGKKSGLWWEYHRIINELQPRIAVMENVSAITFRGLGAVIGSLSEIGYNAEWCTIRASDFGAPHQRERWFCVAYSNRERSREAFHGRPSPIDSNWEEIHRRRSSSEEVPISTHSHRSSIQGNRIPIGIQTRYTNIERDIRSPSFWRESEIPQPTIRRMDDGLSEGLDRATIRRNKQRLKALGNAIVPQCSEWIGKKIWESGLLLD